MDFILFCFILSCFILFYFILFCFVLFCFVLFCFVLFCFILFYFVLFCFILFCFVLLCFMILLCLCLCMFYFFCFVLFCFVLFILLYYVYVRFVSRLCSYLSCVLCLRKIVLPCGVSSVLCYFVCIVISCSVWYCIFILGSFYIFMIFLSFIFDHLFTDEADRDGDGEISEDEFLRIMKKTSLY